MQFTPPLPASYATTIRLQSRAYALRDTQKKESRERKSRPKGLLEHDTRRPSPATPDR